MTCRVQTHPLRHTLWKLLSLCHWTASFIECHQLQYDIAISSLSVPTLAVLVGLTEVGTVRYIINNKLLLQPKRTLVVSLLLDYSSSNPTL